MKKIIVVGGGPAGMIAAGRAAELGNNVILFEKNAKPGRKLAITGKGRCNITNAKEVTELIENIPGNPFFLYSSFYLFDSFATIDFFEKLGVKTKVERGGRVFPESDKAFDVVDGMRKYISKNNVKMYSNTEIVKVIAENSEIKGVMDSRGKFSECGSVIIATGGLSYPGTGSTGDGYKFAENLGHSIVEPRPSLTGLLVKEDFTGELQGLSLKNVRINIYENGIKIYEDFGEMLFTENGVSGPVILSASRHLCGKEKNGAILSIDMKPALSEQELDKRMLRDFEEAKNKDFKNSLGDLLPQRLIGVMVSLSGISPVKKINSVTKEERMRLIGLIKGFKLTVCGSAGFDEAVITVGGVSTKEIDPSTMESKLVKGLFFAGEVIDVDGYTGGYNLQIAFSTGFCAGTYA